MYVALPFNSEIHLNLYHDLYLYISAVQFAVITT